MFASSPFPADSSLRAEMSGDYARAEPANGITTRTIAPGMFSRLRYRPAMPNADNLTPADPADIAAALAFALRDHGRKRVHNADEIMAEIVARRLVDQLAQAGFVVMKRPTIGGHSAISRGFDGQ